MIAKRCPMCTGDLVDRRRRIKASYPKNGEVHTRTLTTRVCLECKISVMVRRLNRPKTGTSKVADQHVRDGWTLVDRSKR